MYICEIEIDTDTDGVIWANRRGGEKGRDKSELEK